MLKSAEDTETDRQDRYIRRRKKNQMPPQLEANKKQHFNTNTENKSMHLVFTQQ